MGRKSAFESLEPEKKAKVLAFIRANRHKVIDDIQTALLEVEGVDIARSTLHRTITKINARDQLLARAEEQTVVTVVDRVTGEVRVIKTCMPGDLVEALIRQTEVAA